MLLIINPVTLSLTDPTYFYRLSKSANLCQIIIWVIARKALRATKICFADERHEFSLEH